MSWDGQKNMLAFVLYDTQTGEGTVEIRWKPEVFDIDKAEIAMDGQILEARKCYDPGSRTLSIKYKHNEPTIEIEIYCCGTAK